MYDSTVVTAIQGLISAADEQLIKIEKDRKVQPKVIDPTSNEAQNEVNLSKVRMVRNPKCFPYNFNNFLQCLKIHIYLCLKIIILVVPIPTLGMFSKHFCKNSNTKNWLRKLTLLLSCKVNEF